MASRTALPLDWDALDSQAPDDDRELLKCLRILGDIAGLHRSTTDDEPPAEVPGRADRRPRAAEAGRGRCRSRGAAIV